MQHPLGGGACSTSCSIWSSSSSWWEISKVLPLPLPKVRGYPLCWLHIAIGNCSRGRQFDSNRNGHFSNELVADRNFESYFFRKPSIICDLFKLSFGTFSSGYAVLKFDIFTLPKFPSTASHNRSKCTVNSESNLPKISIPFGLGFSKWGYRLVPYREYHPREIARSTRSWLICAGIWLVNVKKSNSPRLDIRYQTPSNRANLRILHPISCTVNQSFLWTQTSHANYDQD